MHRTRKDEDDFSSVLGDFLRDEDEDEDEDDFPSVLGDLRTRTRTTSLVFSGTFLGTRTRTTSLVFSGLS